MAKTIKKQTPTNVRLGSLKAPLQAEATKQDRSLHWLIKKILSDFLNGLR